jgi:clorobiocin biosynthesis protein CloN6
MYFPFLGTSGDVPITPLYEYFPVGFRSLRHFLSSRGFEVKIINLSTLLIRYPRIDIDRLINSLDVRLLGIDLHWMVHVQGCLAVAERIKRLRPDLQIILGGISSTYYADELIQYPFIDMVMRGYDTHEPMSVLLQALRQGLEPWAVPNLMWKDTARQIYDNRFSHKPPVLGCEVDWSSQPLTDASVRVPIREVLPLLNAGCSRNCGWCGGSRQAFSRIFQPDHSLVPKAAETIKAEFQSLHFLPCAETYYVYSVGAYNLPPARMKSVLDSVEASGVRAINYEQYYLTPDDILKRMAKANSRTTITLSPESHDPRVATLAGRGVYTNDQMESWVERALNLGIQQVDIWYFIGMPEQDETSVMGTVAYVQGLLRRFAGQHVNPMICPMIPFLDPGSNFFEYSERHGYRTFYRTAEQHRRGMERASIINRINYETQWLKREELVYVGYRAIKQVMEAKAETRALPTGIVEQYNARIDDAAEFVGIVHAVDQIEDPEARARELDKLGDEIERRNNQIFFSGVSNQAFPINRQIGGRWFDELGWPAEVLDAECQMT